MKSEKSSTGWSDPIKVTVSHSKSHHISFESEYYTVQIKWLFWLIYHIYIKVGRYGIKFVCTNCQKSLFNRKPQPVLTVSPSWLSPGDSVTLSCSVKDPSAGWRFFWYKAVPKLPGRDYSYELLPDSINGTEQDSYIVHGQTHTAGYVCRAGRGDPVYYTDYSESKFVWSGDFQSSVSLTVSPDRVQHFTSDSVSLNCEGNSSEWRVRRLSS
ncbi:hypothetical protein L3Q82_016766 [Scortum barcoo]|uniref:Uncharacterized protein n=1 Tax=Scortum barcoo TaxID=214431 RepID=A0ACB8X846_9TELE|nr:hypothetical protein L3Q82_016766 [Scortum barcoo]